MTTRAAARGVGAAILPRGLPSPNLMEWCELCLSIGPRGSRLERVCLDGVACLVDTTSTAVSDRGVQEAEGAASRRGLVVCLRKVAPSGKNSWEMVEATVVDSRPLTETWPRPSI